MGELMGWFGFGGFFVGMGIVAYFVFDHLQDIREREEWEFKDEGLHDNNTDEV